MEASVWFAPANQTKIKNNQMKSTNYDNQMKRKRRPAEADDFAALIGLDWGARHMRSVSTIAPPVRAKAPPWNIPRSHRSLGDRAGQALPSWEDRLCLEQAKGPLISALMAYPFLVFTRSIRRPRPATVRPLRPAGPRAIPPMPRSASSCFSTTAPNSLPGSQGSSDAPVYVRTISPRASPRRRRISGVPVSLHSRHPSMRGRVLRRRRPLLLCRHRAMPRSRRMGSWGYTPDASRR